MIVVCGHGQLRTFTACGHGIGSLHCGNRGDRLPANAVIILRVRTEVEGAVPHACPACASMTSHPGAALSPWLAACLAAAADRIDRLVAAIGRAVMWLCLFLVLLQFTVVLLRYAFAIGSIWLSELHHLRSCRAVSAGGGMDVAAERSRARRRLLLQGLGPATGGHRSPRARSCCCFP